MKAATNISGKMHPQLFALYLGLGGIVMMFAALTSAYIVRQAAGNWLEFRLPNLFFMSTAVILVSSITLQYAYHSFVQGKFTLYKSMLWATLLEVGCKWKILAFILLEIPPDHSYMQCLVYMLSMFWVVLQLY